MKQIKIRLLSETTFGRGDGVPGLVDDEIDYDPDTGLPLVKGRTVKGLLVEECANILDSLSRARPGAVPALERSAQRLFGAAGSREQDAGWLHYGEARVADAIRQAVAAAIAANQNLVSPMEILDSLTGIRRRSAVDEQSEAPADETLRSVRVLIRETEFFSPLVELQPLHDQDWHLLAACVAAVRRVGKNRHRGAGHVECSLWENGKDVTQAQLERFTRELTATEADA
jgi:hypothetical protein